MYVYMYMYLYMQQFRSSWIRRNVTFQKSRILDYTSVINPNLAYTNRLYAKVNESVNIKT